jgi:hypothetical protein
VEYHESLSVILNIPSANHFNTEYSERWHRIASTHSITRLMILWTHFDYWCYVFWLILYDSYHKLHQNAIITLSSFRIRNWDFKKWILCIVNHMMFNSLFYMDIESLKRIFFPERMIEESMWRFCLKLQRWFLEWVYIRFLKKIVIFAQQLKICFCLFVYSYKPHIRLFNAKQHIRLCLMVSELYRYC